MSIRCDIYDRKLYDKGREDEAEQAVRYFEQAGGVEPVASPKGEPLPKIIHRPYCRHRGQRSS